MKRIVAWLLVLTLLLSTGAIAAADTTERTIRASDVELNKYSKTMAVRLEGEEFYCIMDAEGNLLSGVEKGYTNAYPLSNYPFFSVNVKSSDGIHDEGLIDGWGNVLVPPMYADVNVISDRWQAGIKLTPCSADDKDYTVTNYSTNEKAFYRIDTADIYFDGQMVGSLSRSDYGGGSCNAYNAYLSITNTSKERIFYNSNLEPSPYKATYSGEFDTVRSKGVTSYIHQGSGQTAFASSCTLNPDDLVAPYLYDRGQVMDLQGNVLFKTAQVYDTVRDFQNGYAQVRIDRKYGLIDLNGNEVIPTEYAQLGNYESNPLAFGYISAVKGDKFGFLDAQGNVTCPFVYSKDVVSNRGTFGTVKNLDGTIIVLSAAVGELSEHFADVTFPAYDGCMSFVGKNADGQYCVVDLYGNTLLPYKDGYRSIYLSADGTLGVVYYGNREYEIIHFEIGAPAAPVAVEDDTWTCENGHSGNTGAFCTECGVPKPVNDEPITHCPNCGYDFGDKTPKFCPECGTKIEP